MALPYAPARWPAATATVVLWGAAAASIVFWGLRLTTPADAAAPPAVGGPVVPSVDAVALSHFLGGVSSEPVATATPDAASRFALLGVVADTDGQGVALIAVDGKPPRPFRIGSSIGGRTGGSYVLQSVGPRAATLGAGGTSAPAFTLQMPTRPLAVLLPPQVLSLPEAP
ncbi:MAG: hypothetical protein JWQ73_3807 [Variovorax sp.]|nr:hypothetical protein [Variovorax sp.]